MKFGIERDLIDKVIVSDIKRLLTQYGVPADKAFAAYDAIRFQAEARAVLLNRVQDRKMPTAGINYYGQYLDEVAEGVGMKYDPFQPE